MFQKFDSYPSTDNEGKNLIALRDRLGELGVNAFLVPRGDEYLNEFVPPSAERLRWLTGFSGSAGMAIVGIRQSALFVDGRYTTQAAEQVNTELLDIRQIPQNKTRDWLTETLKGGDSVAYDPNLHTVRQIRDLQKALSEKGIALKPVRHNPIDRLWKDRPAAPTGPVQIHPLKYAGRKAEDKISELQNKLRENKVDAVLIASPESIAWLFNIRGSDVSHTPVVLGHAILHARKKPDLFIHPDKLSAASVNMLKKTARLRTPEELNDNLKALASKNPRVQLDIERTPTYFHGLLQSYGAEIVEMRDPCALPRSVKNSIEIEGARAAHIRDGVAVTRFLSWIDTATQTDNIDEIGAAARLEEFRAETGKLRDISFDSISGAGPNGAIIHYRVTRDSVRKLKRGSLYLIDSGGQYLDGTTDITRTVAIGQPTAAMARHFTLVLKGHIAIDRAKFPVGTRGQDLDPLARVALWAHGLDYDHGTGHGVGSYLSVHEGPPSISRLSAQILKPGMILSNEPGYYRVGKYGIRIENLILVKEIPTPRNGDRDLLGFETLSLAPIDLNLVDKTLLSDEETDWLNAYHKEVQRKLSPHLEGEEKEWLKKATRTI